MKRLRVYADTSVLGGCFDDEFAEFSTALLDVVRKGEMTLLVSDLLADELIDAPQQVKDLFESLPSTGTERVLSGPESEDLRDRYLAAVGTSDTSCISRRCAASTLSICEKVISRSRSTRPERWCEMPQKKSFDCVAVKDEIQRRRGERYAGLSDQEARQSLHEMLATSPDPVARKWRELAPGEQAGAETPVEHKQMPYSR
jgi:hypothetical protein